MNRASAQYTRSSTPSLPSALPFSNKEEAKKWLEDTLALQGLPQALTEQASTLHKTLNAKDRPWDQLKPELETLHGHVVAEQTPKWLQQFQLQFPASVTVHDPRIDELVKKMKELEIAKQIKDEVAADMEKTRKRLEFDIDGNFDKIKQLRTDLADRDKTITDLEEKLLKLTREKKELENKIKTLENNIDALKQEVGNLQVMVAEKDGKIKSLMEMHEKRLESMVDRIEELEAKNKESAKMSQSKILVGETMKITVKAIYMHVHPTLKHRKKNCYSVYEISDHLTKKYTSNPAEKKAAEERWEKLKGSDIFGLP